MTVSIKASSPRGQSINYTTLQCLSTYLYLPRLIDNQKSMIMRASKQSRFYRCGRFKLSDLARWSMCEQLSMIMNWQMGQKPSCDHQLWQVWNTIMILHSSIIRLYCVAWPSFPTLSLIAKYMYFNTHSRKSKKQTIKSKILKPVRLRLINGWTAMVTR